MSIIRALGGIATPSAPPPGNQYGDTGAPGVDNAWGDGLVEANPTDGHSEYGSTWDSFNWVYNAQSLTGQPGAPGSRQVQYHFFSDPLQKGIRTNVGTGNAHGAVCPELGSADMEVFVQYNQASQYGGIGLRMNPADWSGWVIGLAEASGRHWFRVWEVDPLLTSGWNNTWYDVIGELLPYPVQIQALAQGSTITLNIVGTAHTHQFTDTSSFASQTYAGIHSVRATSYFQNFAARAL